MWSCDLNMKGRRACKSMKKGICLLKTLSVYHKVEKVCILLRYMTIEKMAYEFDDAIIAIVISLALLYINRGPQSQHFHRNTSGEAFLKCGSKGTEPRVCLKQN